MLSVFVEARFTLIIEPTVGIRHGELIAKGKSQLQQVLIPVLQ